jgi:hypothetical protein
MGHLDSVVFEGGRNGEHSANETLGGRHLVHQQGDFANISFESVTWGRHIMSFRQKQGVISICCVVLAYIGLS